jgi:hypothetical protein
MSEVCTRYAEERASDGLEPPIEGEAAGVACGAGPAP